jgi:PIN domain nuclease of toxin-antitoxin system
MRIGMLVLDTHIWIFLLNGDMKIKKSGFLSVIKNAVRNTEIKISSISLWETATLSMKGRISFSENLLDWFKKALSAPGISLSPITPEIASDSANLPENFHGDPADRIIVASARTLNASLLTFDEKILDYSSKGHVKVIKPK